MTLPVLNGFSGSIDSLAGADEVIQALKDYDGNCYRIAFNPQWTNGSRPWEATVQYGPDGETKINYILNHPDFKGKYLIVDRSHMTDQDSGGELPYTGTTVRSWNTVRQNAFDMCELYKGKENVIICIVNEYWWSTMYVYCEQLVQDLRNAGYTNPILNNKHNHAFDWDRHKTENPSLDFYGMHWYFTDESDYRLYSEWLKHMDSARDNGCLPLCHTEIGASHLGTQTWTQAQMDRLNDAVHESNARGNGCLVWMQKDADYRFKYEQLGFDPQWKNGGEGLSFVNETTKTVVVYKRPIVLDVKIGTVPAGGSLDVLIDESKEKLIIKDS